MSMVGLPTAEFKPTFEEGFPNGDGDSERSLSSAGADCDVRDVLEVGLGVAVTKEPISPPVSPDIRLEASAGSMVCVVGGNTTVAPGVRAKVRVTVSPLFVDAVELPLWEEVDVSVLFEILVLVVLVLVVLVVLVVLDVSPSPTPAAPMIDRAFASLVHARNVPLLLTEGNAKHSLSPPGHVWVCHVPFEH